MHRLLPALFAAVAFAAVLGMAAAAAPHQAWAQGHDETRHGRLAVEETTYVLERHTPVTVRVTGQIFAESGERRQVDVVVTLPDSSRSEQSALATRGGHFAVPYQLDKPFPIGADSRPGRYKVSASHGGASLGTVYFEVVRPPQVPAAAAPAREDAAGDPGAADAAGGVSGLSASVSRSIYSPDAAVTVHGTAEGAGAGVRLRIDVAGPSAGVVYSGVLTTSIAGTYSATIMPPGGRWGGDGEYTAVVTGAGQLARAPFWVESGDVGGEPAMDGPRAGGTDEPGTNQRQAEAVVPAPSDAADPVPGGERGTRDAATRVPDAEGDVLPSTTQQSREAAGAQAAPSTGPDAPIVLAAAVAVAAVVAVAVAVAVLKASGSKEVYSMEDGGPVARRPVARRPVAPDGVATPAHPTPTQPDFAAASVGAVPRRAPATEPADVNMQSVLPEVRKSDSLRRPPEPGSQRGMRSGGMRIVLDTSVVINHAMRSKGILNDLNIKSQLEYVDIHKDDLLLPERDIIPNNIKEHAIKNLKPFESIYDYGVYERVLEGLRKSLVDNPLSDESISWIVRKFRRLDPKRARIKDGVRVGDILNKIGMYRKKHKDISVELTAREIVAEYGRAEGGKEDLAYLLRRLNAAASSDLQMLAIAMKESEERFTILLTNDYDLFAFPIWHDYIDKSECGPVTMVLSPTDVRWIISMHDGSARVIDDKARAEELCSEEDYDEVSRALRYSKTKS